MRLLPALFQAGTAASFSVRLRLNNESVRSAKRKFVERAFGRIRDEGDTLGRGDLGLLFHQLDGAVKTAKFIDQAILFRLLAQPDTALGQRFDFVESPFTRIRNFGDEGPVIGVDTLAKLRAALRIERLVVGIYRGESPSGNQFLVHTELVLETVQIRLADYDAD